VHESLVATAQ